MKAAKQAAGGKRHGRVELAEEADEPATAAAAAKPPAKRSKKAVRTARRCCGVQPRAALLTAG